MDGQDLANTAFNTLYVTNRVMAAAYAERQPVTTQASTGKVEFIDRSSGEVKTIRYCDEE